MATDCDASHSEDHVGADPVQDLGGGVLGRRRRHDTAEVVELLGAVIDEELAVRVLSQQGDEFTCSHCFLVHHRSQHASDTGDQLVCTECAA